MSEEDAEKEYQKRADMAESYYHRSQVCTMPLFNREIVRVYADTKSSPENYRKLASSFIDAALGYKKNIEAYLLKAAIEKYNWENQEKKLVRVYEDICR